MTPKVLDGGSWAIRRALDLLEKNLKYKVKVLFEPQMGKRGLYPTLSTKNSDEQVRLMMNFISLFYGDSSLLKIAEIIGVPSMDLYELVYKLTEHNLISET